MLSARNFAFAFLMYPVAMMASSLPPVQACPSCFSASETPFVSILAGAGVDGKGSPDNINGSLYPLQNGLGGHGSDGSFAYASYSVGLATGISFSDQTYGVSYSAGAEAEPSIFDYLDVVGATAGSTVVVTAYTDVVGTASYNGGTVPTSGNLFSLYLDVLGADPLSDLGESTDCQKFNLNNSSGGFAGTCQSSVSLPPNGHIAVDLHLYDNASSIGGASGTVFNSVTEIAGVQVFDALGNPEPNVTLYDASGVNYNAVTIPSAAETPEPSGIVFLRTGFFWAWRLAARCSHKETSE